MKLKKVVGLTWSGGLDVYNLYSECAGGISQQVRYIFLLIEKLIPSYFIKVVKIKLLLKLIIILSENGETPFPERKNGLSKTAI